MLDFSTAQSHLAARAQPAKVKWAHKMWRAPLKFARYSSFQRDRLGACCECCSGCMRECVCARREEREGPQRVQRAAAAAELDPLAKTNRWLIELVTCGNSIFNQAPTFAQNYCRIVKARPQHDERDRTSQRQGTITACVKDVCGADSHIYPENCPRRHPRAPPRVCRTLGFCILVHKFD
jgi:hypothetical protein